MSTPTKVQKDHYVPVFLQKAFSFKYSPEDEVDFSYHVHKKGGIRPSNIKEIGMKKGFDIYKKWYADATFGNVEGAVYRPFIEKMLGNQFDPQLDSDLAKELLVHLHVRTKNFRDAASSYAKPLQKKIVERLSNASFFKEYMMGILTLDKYAHIRPLILEHTDFSLETLIEGCGNLSDDTTPQAITAMLLEASAQLSTSVSTAIKAGILQVLSSDAAPIGFQESLEGFVFSVEHWPDGALVLGDAPVVFFDSTKDCFINFIGGGVPFDLAFLPLSPTHALVAKRKAAIPTPAWTTLQLASVTCAHEFFISKSSGEHLKELKNQMGTSIFSFSEEALEQMAEDFFQLTYPPDEDTEVALGIAADSRSKR